VCGATDTGVQRAENQDTFVIAALDSGELSRPCIKTDVWVARPGLLMLVCDGMGGHAAGDLAAQIAAAAIHVELEQEGENVGRAPDQALKRAVLGANQAIREEAAHRAGTKGMGTTCTAAIVCSDRLAVAQVGDSRAYLLRAGELRTLTRDQTLAEELVEKGVLKPQEVERFPLRHVLAQALGIEPHVEPVMTNVDLAEGDRLLLCSDGLHGAVPGAAIREILHTSADVHEASSRLVEAALAAGGPDNVTVVVADCGPLRAS
jgi:protein phosphatase